MICQLMLELLQVKFWNVEITFKGNNKAVESIQLCFYLYTNVHTKIEFYLYTNVHTKIEFYLYTNVHTQRLNFICILMYTHKDWILSVY